MKAILNAAVIPGPGRYFYRIVSRREAVAWLARNGARAVSYIGYTRTVEHVQELCGIRFPLSRERIAMKPGDEALVVRLSYRVPDPASKASNAPVPDENWEYGLLFMEAS